MARKNTVDGKKKPPLSSASAGGKNKTKKQQQQQQRTKPKLTKNQKKQHQLRRLRSKGVTNGIQMHVAEGVAGLTASSLSLSSRQQQKKVAPNLSDKKTKKKKIDNQNQNDRSKKERKKAAKLSSASNDAIVHTNSSRDGKKQSSKKRKRNDYSDLEMHSDDFALSQQLASMSQATYSGGVTLDGGGSSKNKKSKNKTNTSKKNGSNGPPGRGRSVSVNSRQIYPAPSAITKNIKLPKVASNQPPMTLPSTSKKDQQCPRLLLMNSCFKVNAATMKQFDDELVEFAEYVRLSPEEHHARLYMIEQVQTLSQRLFDLKDPQRSVQVFGSFICPQVCVYQSDIDLAIWDVVPTSQTDDEYDHIGSGTHLRFGTSSSDLDSLNMNRKVASSAPSSAGYAATTTSTTCDDDKNDAVAGDGDPQSMSERAHRNVKKQERILQWKAALDQVLLADRKDQHGPETSDGNSDHKDDSNDDGSGEDIAKVTEDEEGNSTSDKEQREKADHEKDSTLNVTDENVFFVLDRKGVSTHDDSQILAGSPTKATCKLQQACPTPVASNRTESHIEQELTKTSQPKCNPSKNNTGEDTDGNCRDSSEGGNESDIESIIDTNTDGNDVDNSDDDTADKLEGLCPSRASKSLEDGNFEETGITHFKSERSEVKIVGLKHPRSDDEDVRLNDDEAEVEDEVQIVGVKRPRCHSIVSLCSATTCSDDERFDESGMEVSYTVRPAKRRFTLEGRARTLVVNALYKLTKIMRPLAAQNNLHVRKNAKVPIINMETRFGFECDIAIGGHNGSDTSSFASVQAARFKSFSTVVVILKILLSQHRLDKPFTGGIGSYALYVLVTSHIEQHLRSGGGDGPAELLFSFLFRYGAVKHSHNNLLPSMKTRLTKGIVVETIDGGGTIDTTPCYQIESCVKLFSLCWYKLYTLLQRDNFNPEHSIIQHIVDSNKLAVDRAQKQKQTTDHLKSVFGADRFRREIEPSLQKKQHTRRSTDNERVQEGEGSVSFLHGLPPLEGFESSFLSSSSLAKEVSASTASRSVSSSTTTTQRQQVQRRKFNRQETW